ncbi:ribonuclease toxin HepT-like protein [Limnochorda pilosa]|uniref:ribonuclease toxin HepT-like protein n=1 Tax=Limnochorda pilosa TaxID=1555112 RepID=UPI00187DC6A2|nr:hypothetical protein [Limnochorda pilosa]
MRARVEEERASIARLKDELTRYRLFPQITATEVGGFPLGDVAVSRIVGSILHDLYAAIENVFKIIASRLDRSVPSGEQWHRELVDQMTLDVPGLRPAVISRTTAAVLDPLRGFRHVFRNVYGFHLAPERITPLLRSLPGVLQAFEEDIDRFLLRMETELHLAEQEESQGDAAREGAKPDTEARDRGAPGTGAP